MYFLEIVLRHFCNVWQIRYTTVINMKRKPEPDRIC